MPQRSRNASAALITKLSPPSGTSCAFELAQVVRDDQPQAQMIAQTNCLENGFNLMQVRAAAEHTQVQLIFA
ncbi:MAG: hypothetical protein WKF30_04695 [Pyrinomonadaceae bacterium]